MILKDTFTLNLSIDKVINVDRATPTIKLKDIIMIEGMSNYSLIQTKTGPIVCTKSLKFFEQLIKDEQFVRTHKSHIVNLAYLRTYKCIDGTHTLELKNGQILEVARRRSQDFRLKI